MRRLAAACGLLVLVATPAAAENPVLDADGDADVAAALADATTVQQVCYGYALDVFDQDTGVFSGAFAASSLGAGVRASALPGRCRDVVELRAEITYTSSFSDAPDSASWTVSGTLPQLTIADVERLGLSSDDLLDDSTSETTLLNAVLALPRLASEQAGVAPVVLDPAAQAPPADARPTGTPGSDWLRENGALLALCVLLVVGGAALLLSSRRRTAYRPG